MKRAIQLLSALIAVQCVTLSQGQPLSRAGTMPDEVGPNYKVWRTKAKDGVGEQYAVTPVQRADAPTFPDTGGGVVEIGTGMQYWDGEQWSPSDPSFELTDDGFVATRVQHQVRLNAQLNWMGSVNVTMRDGVAMSSTPVGIALLDPTSGRFRVIAGLTNSTGVLVASNQVVYPSAFSGGVCADVVYTLQQGTFEQDIVITGNLDPEDYGFPTNSQIQVLTEMYQPQMPGRVRRPIYVEKNEKVRLQKAKPDLIDEVLDFGEFVIGTGQAYVPPTTLYTNGTQTVVAKEVTTVMGRTFLIETVDSGSFREGLKALPSCEEGAGAAAMIRRTGAEGDGFASVPRPQSRTAQAKAKPQRAPQLALARAEHGPRSGVVIDYIATIGGSCPTTFRGETTYHVTSSGYFNGPLIIEGGAVVKYNSGTFLSLNAGAVCRTSSYRPAIFTRVNDDTVGESLIGRSGYSVNNPLGYANPALTASFVSLALSHVQIRYAQEAVRMYGGDVAITLSHSQLLDCVRGITLTACGDSTGSSSSSSGSTWFAVSVKDVLFSLVDYPLLGYSNGSAPSSGGFGIISFYSCTFDQIVGLTDVNYYASLFPCAFNNCVLANVAALGNSPKSGSYNGFYNCAGFGTYQFTPTDSSSPFGAAVGGGAYYLTDTSGFKNRGITTGLPTDLVTDLRKRTTDPPVIPASAISAATTWPVQARRDTDTLDLGYHYAPLDYLVNDLTLSATLALSEGAAVGVTGDSGFQIQPGGRITSEGSPMRMNQLASAANVQEQPAAANSTLMILTAGCATSDLDFRFTEFSVGQGKSGTLLDTGTGNAYPFERLSFRDCRLYCGMLTFTPGLSSAAKVALTNNILERCRLTLGQLVASVSTPFEVHLYNNLFLGDPSSATLGTPPALALSYDSSHYTSAWEVHDNLFDQATQTMNPASPVPARVHLSNNGFTSGTTHGLVGAYDQVLTAALVYQQGPLGTYYLPSTATQLIDGGSRTAALAGLYHYTSRNIVSDKEAGTQVDIGFHYAGVTGANPNYVVRDSDGDGLADYFEDTNGNGTYDSSSDLADWTPGHTDTDGDGVNDYLEWLQGRNLRPGTTATDNGSVTGVKVQSLLVY